MQKVFLILFLALMVFPVFALSQITTAQQIGLCGAENISMGTKGEVRIRTQAGGTDLNTETCWPKSCSAGMAASTVVSDKYKSGSADIFVYQKICMADVDSLSLSECSSMISSEAQKCSPPACSAGYLDAGQLTELRDKLGNFWTENVYRLCAKGSKIENATLVFKENYGKFSAPEQCPANFSDAGVFRQTHFNSSEYYRAWRICAKFAMQGATTTTSLATTTTTPSNLETAKTIAIANLSAMLNVLQNNLTVDVAEAVRWSDGSVGCPKPGYAYTQAEVGGYRIILSYQGKKYYYHSGSDGKSFYCENPKEPIKATTSSTTTIASTTTLKPTTTSTAATYPTTTYFPTTSFPVPAPTIGKSPCSESDGGISIYSAGSVRVENGTLYLDACVENNLINEYYCSNGTASIYTGNCTAGCLNSACRGAGEALLEKGALLAGRVVDTVNYVIDLVARGKILERGADLVGKIIDTVSSALDVISKLIGKGSQYVDTIEITNKTGNMTNLTNAIS